MPQCSPRVRKGARRCRYWSKHDPHYRPSRLRPSLPDLGEPRRFGRHEPGSGLFGGLRHPRHGSAGAGGSRPHLHHRARQRHMLHGDPGHAASRGGPGHRRHFETSRPLLASPDERQPAALDRPGKGRDPSCDRGHRQRRLGSPRKGCRQTGVASRRRHVGGRDRRYRRLPLLDGCSHPRRGGRDPAAGRARQSRADRQARKGGLPLLHHFCRLARL